MDHRQSHTPKPRPEKRESDRKNYADESKKESSSADRLPETLLHPDQSQGPNEPLGRDGKGG